MSLVSYSHWYLSSAASFIWMLSFPCDFHLNQNSFHNKLRIERIKMKERINCLDWISIQTWDMKLGLIFHIRPDYTDRRAHWYSGLNRSKDKYIPRYYSFTNKTKRFKCTDTSSDARYFIVYCLLFRKCLYTFWRL